MLTRYTHCTYMSVHSFHDGALTFYPEPYGAFYFAINKPSNGTRGRSDLINLFDWLDLYDQ